MCRGCYLIFYEAMGFEVQGVPPETTLVTINEDWFCLDSVSDKASFRPALN
jgi:rubredoxin